ncbi:hypothetical protein B0H11DRAFT_1715957 [Mycena galericulata]|nr:hypothetical protein B0H11DRAFT_1715957 [Mycena galericulata]
MPRASNTSTEKAAATPYNIMKSKKRSLLAQSGAATLENIQVLQKTGLTKHSKAANTTKKYGESVRNARKWLGVSTGDVTDKKKGKSKVKQRGEDLNSDDEEEEDEPEDPAESFKFGAPEYKMALDDIPNEHSPKVLSLYLTYKIFHQGLKIGTADTARAAFKELWKMADGDTYRGRWHFSKTSERWEGNPTESAEVEDTMKAIKNKCGQDGGDRTHSLAMTKEFMAKLFTWSDEVCPPSTYFNTTKTREELTLATKHLMFKAFSSTGWTIWTRNFELIKLKEKDLSFDLEDPQAFNTPYIELRLNNRKGWQRKINKAQKEADLRSGKYKICSQPDLPACDPYYWLPLWRKYLQEIIYRRPLQPDDYIFPAIGANGVVQVGEHVSHDDVQKWIKEFTAGAQLLQANGTFSTHCFRHGGAQYRFMFAPVGRRWTLRQVRWWGGWAEGEHRDTLIKYLLDELGTYEDDYSGLLLPNQPDMDRTFLGEGSLLAAATTGQLNLLHQSLSTDMRAVSNTLGTLVETFAKMGPYFASSSGSSSYPRVDHSHSMSLNHQILHQHQNSSLSVTSSTRAIIPIAVPPLLNTPSTYYVPNSSAPAIPVEQGNSPPTPHLVIPDIPVTLADGTRSPRHESWRIIIQHWTDGDSNHGLHTPLKDWPKVWLTGMNKRFAMKHHDRMVIATEFLSQYKSDEASFLAAYPEAQEGVSALLRAVNRAREARGDRIRRKR